MEYLNLRLNSHRRRFWMATQIKENPLATPDVIKSFAEMLPKKDTDHSWLIYEHMASLAVPHFEKFLGWENEDILDGILRSFWFASIKNLWNKTSFHLIEGGLKTYLVERYSVLHPEISSYIKGLKGKGKVEPEDPLKKTLPPVTEAECDSI